MLSKGSKNQIFHQYNKSVIFLFMVIILLALIVTYYSYHKAKEHHNNNKLSELIEDAIQLNSRISRTVDTLNGLRNLSEFYLEFPENINKNRPKLKQNGSYFLLDKSRKSIISPKVIVDGSITGIGQIDEFTLDKLNEINMAHALTSAFVAAKSSLKEADWLFYISKNKFLVIYPWVPPSLWQYNENSFTNDLMLTLEKNDNREQELWSRPYKGTTGLGLNTTLGLGVYSAGNMIGAVLININTAILYDYLPEVEHDNHGYIVIDANNNVLLHKQKNTIKLNKIKKFRDEAPKSLQHLNYQTLESQPVSSEINDWILHKQNLQINGWVLIEYQDSDSFFSAISQRFKMIFASLFICLTTLMITIYYVVYQNFIVPSQEFISHIEYCSVGDPGKIKPKFEWRHWFKIVEDLFGENRTLLQRLRDHNDELDNKVKEKTQALVEKSEQHQRDFAILRSVMDAIPDFILFNDKQGRLIGCNKSIEKILLQNEIDILGIKIEEILNNMFDKDVAGEIQLIGKDKEVITVRNESYEIYKAPFFDERNELLGNIILIQDVTQQYNINRALERAKTQAEEANKIKTQFLANMSHEIRTPINALQGMLYLLKKSKIDNVQQHYLQNAQSASKTLLFLVDELLDSAKVESGNMSIHIETTALENILMRAINLNISLLNQKNLLLNVTVESEVPLLIETDPMRLEQVISNLLNNAIKFTKQGVISLSMSIEYSEDKVPTLIISVKDTGIGIEKSQQAHLFKPFKQADDSMTRMYGGAGLGLSICQHILFLLGGSIDLKSNINQGSNFIVSLPLSVSENNIESDSRAQVNLLSFNERLVNYSLFYFNMDFPISLITNFLDIDSQVTKLNSLEHLSRSQGGNNSNILFIDSAKFPQGFSPSEVQLLNKHIMLVALCQHKESPVPQALLEQLNHDHMEYLLLDFPLYRFVVNKIIEKVQALSITEELNNSFNLNTEKKEERINITGKKVLVAEDNHVNQLVARKLLESLGFTVIICSNGQEAINTLHQENIDIILMDIQMPIMDGITATKHIRSIPKYNNIPIIAMTAHARKEDKHQCLAAGMDLHIIKPINIEVLQEKLSLFMKQ